MSESGTRGVGRAPSDPELRATVGAFFGVLLMEAMDWVHTEDSRVLAKVDEALGHLENGPLR